MTSYLPSDSSSQPPLDPPREKPLPPQITFWYRVLDWPEDDAETITLDATSDVSGLRRAIAPNVLDPFYPEKTIHITNIEIWQLNFAHVHEAADDAKWANLLTNYGTKMSAFATLLHNTVQVAEILPRRKADKPLLNLIIVRKRARERVFESDEEKEEQDKLTALNVYSKRYVSLRDITKSASAKTPSAAAASANFRESQAKEHPIYDGRRPLDPGVNRSTLAIPASLYHPVFQRWRLRAADPNFNAPAGLVAATARLMEAASILYPSENDRKVATRQHLQDTISHGIQHVVNADYTSADGRTTVVARWGTVSRSVPAMMGEEKRDAADSRQDATTQGAFSMRRAWFDDDLSVFRNLGCCPTFLVGFSGAHLVVSAAVLTDKLIVERLAMWWVGHSSTHDDDHTQVIARALHALSLGIDELCEWYKTLDNRALFDEEKKTPANHPRFFPFAYRYPVVAEDFSTVVEFEYLCPLQPDQSTCVTFHAITKGSNPKEVVVKFVQRYCREVHDVLAVAGMAPAILYYGRIDPDVDYGNWKMVVMEYLEAKPSYVGDRHRDADVSKKVLEAIQIVHSAGYVLGDIRPPNVMIGEEGKIKLIDFDWAGEWKEGDEGVRYPAYMSNDIWTDGIAPMEKIKQSHDIDMHARWFSPNSPCK